jgi:CRP-like cAMP-binding protein
LRADILDQFPGEPVATKPAIPEQVSGNGSSLSRALSIDRFNVMRTSALFSGLSHGEALEIAGLARLRSFERHEVLFMQGQPVRQLLLIESGSVKLTQLSSNGSEVILWLSGAGESIGATGFFSHSYHTCSASAVVRCRALTWEWSRMENSFHAYSTMGRNIGHILSSRLSELEERFREVATEKVSRRVALALLRSLRNVGNQSGAGIEVSLSREELAQLTGTTLFTISRLMSKWHAQGIVLPRREAVVVLDQERLAIAAEEDD